MTFTGKSAPVSRILSARISMSLVILMGDGWLTPDERLKADGQQVSTAAVLASLSREIS